MRYVATALMAATLGGATIAAAGDSDPPRQKPKPQLVDGKNVRWWAKRARANGAGMRWQRKRVARLERELRPQRESATQAIAYVFGPYASQALRVAYCESRYYVGAANGQYLGLFQMGEFARGRYGHGWSPWAQAVSAYRYFADSGYDWSPWACRP